MGYTRKILSEKKLHDKSVFYTDNLRIDIAESVHLHFRNFRLELSMEEWKTLVKGFLLGWIRWFWRGRPHYQQTSNHFTLYQDTVDPVAGAGHKSVIRGSSLLVELSQFSDYIHIHHRNTRHELTVDEFLEYANEITKARDELCSMSIMKDYPKRIGFCHIMQPKFRVTESKNVGGFAIHNKRFPDEKSHTHDSIVWNESQGEWEQQVSYYAHKHKGPRFITKVIVKVKIIWSAMRKSKKN